MTFVRHSYSAVFWGLFSSKISVCVCVCVLQVGCFDPYSDDPRLGIQKISLCKYSNKLVVAGTAGQVKVFPRSVPLRQICLLLSFKLKMNS